MCRSFHPENLVCMLVQQRLTGFWEIFIGTLVNKNRYAYSQYVIVGCFYWSYCPLLNFLLINPADLVCANSLQLLVGIQQKNPGNFCIKSRCTIVSTTTGLIFFKGTSCQPSVSRGDGHITRMVRLDNLFWSYSFGWP